MADDSIASSQTDELAISYADLSQQADDLQQQTIQLAAMNGGSVWVGVDNLNSLIDSLNKLLGQIQGSIVNVQGGFYKPFADRDSAVQAIQNSLDTARETIAGGNDYATNREPDAVANEAIANLKVVADAVEKKLPGATSISFFAIAIIVVLVLILAIKLS